MEDITNTEKQLAELTTRHKCHRTLMNNQKTHRALRKEQHRKCKRLNHKPVYCGNLY